MSVLHLVDEPEPRLPGRSATAHEPKSWTDLTNGRRCVVDIRAGAGSGARRAGGYRRVRSSLRLHHLDRGYEGFVDKLELGADVEVTTAAPAETLAAV